MKLVDDFSKGHLRVLLKGMLQCLEAQELGMPADPFQTYLSFRWDILTALTALASAMLCVRAGWGHRDLLMTLALPTHLVMPGTN